MLEMLDLELAFQRFKYFVRIFLVARRIWISITSVFPRCLQGATLMKGLFGAGCKVRLQILLALYKPKNLPNKVFVI